MYLFLVYCILFLLCFRSLITQLQKIYLVMTPIKIKSMFQIQQALLVLLPQQINLVLGSREEDPENLKPQERKINQKETKTKNIITIKV